MSSSTQDPADPPFSFAWRGSPALLTRLVRAAGEVVAEDSNEARTTVGIRVDRDHEHFKTVDDFVKYATPEALRSFKELEITAGSMGRRATVKMAWHRPRWGFDIRPAAKVEIGVEGFPDDTPWPAKAALRQLESAAARGIPWIYGLQAVALGFAAGVLLASAASVSAFEVFGIGQDWSAEVIGLIIGVLSAASGIAGWYICNGVWPALQVAPPEDTSQRRALKAISPVLLLIVGAVVKKILG